MITPAQSRAARALLGWSLQEFAEKSGVNASAAGDLEAGKSSPSASDLNAIRAALEAGGVEFIAENGGGAGVRFRKPGPDPAEIAVEDLNASNDE